MQDQNFRRERLRLGGDSRWFIGQVSISQIFFKFSNFGSKQVYRDADFLRKHGVVDYRLNNNLPSSVDAIAISEYETINH